MGPNYTVVIKDVVVLTCFNALYIILFNMNKHLKVVGGHCRPHCVFITAVHLQHVLKLRF